MVNAIKAGAAPATVNSELLSLAHNMHQEKGH